MEAKHLVFVYGTLRHGHCNHHILQDASCYGKGRTESNYAMYLISGFPYVTCSGANYPIIGELYGVDDNILNLLDRMEGHPRYYERREIYVIAGEERCLAWMYFRDPPGVLMQSGDYNDIDLGKSLIMQ